MHQAKPKTLVQITVNIVTIVTLFFCTSCASIIHKPKQTVTIESTPSGADIYVDGWITKTPAKLQLEGSREKIIEFKKSGYEDKTITVSSRFRFVEVFILNAMWLYFYPLALLSDLSHGSKWQLQSEIETNLEKTK